MTPGSYPAAEIRHAHSEDAEGMAALLGELGYPAPPAVIAERLAGMQAINEVVLLAVRESEVLGVVAVHVTPELHRPTYVGRITMLVVSKNAHGEGIGRALVEESERVVKARGCELIEVTSNRARTGAHAFYERLGYELTSFRFKKSI